MNVWPWLGLWSGLVALVLITTCIGALRVRDWTFPIGALFLTYWSLYGGLWIILDRRLGDQGLRYGYLEGKLFAIHLDYAYALTLVAYGSFVAVALGTVAVLYDRRSLGGDDQRLRVDFDHTRLQLLVVALAALSFFLTRDQLVLAAALNLSGYDVASSPLAPSGGTGVVLQQTTFRAAVLLSFLGVALALAADGGRGRRWRKYRRLGVYGSASVAIVGLAFVLGEKSEIFFGTVVALLAYIQFSRRTSYPLMVGAGLGLLLFIGTVDMLRGTALSELGGQAAPEGLLSGLGTSFFMLGTSNEAFAAHFSLYGTLSRDLPVEWGWSLMSLLASVVPSSLWPGRPETIYQMYVDGVGAIQDQGYTIHHATGWSLTAGPAGVALGAIALGLIWVAAYRVRDAALMSRLGRLSLFGALLPALLVGYFPMFIRSGIEGYKGLMIDAVMVPCLLLSLIQRRARVHPHGP